MEIDLEDLGRQVRDRYGLPIGSLAMAAPGEAAVGLVADGRHFVRAEPAADLEGALAIPAALNRDGGIRAAVAPYRTRGGRFTFRHGPYTVAVFPFVSGQPASGSQIATAASLLAAIHKRRLFLPTLRRVSLDHRLPQAVRQLLRTQSRRESPHAAETRRLLQEERGAIEAVLSTVRRLNSDARKLPLHWAVTHGAPGPCNLLVDGSGSLHLIDWGQAALGPIERDLWHLRGDGFGAALLRYAEETGWRADIHADLLALYEYRGWLLRLVRSAGALLDGHGGERAWLALRSCLPLQPGALEESCTAMAAATAAMGST